MSETLTGTTFHCQADAPEKAIILLNPGSSAAEKASAYARHLEAAYPSVYRQAKTIYTDPDSRRTIDELRGALGEPAIITALGGDETVRIAAVASSSPDIHPGDSSIVLPVGFGNGCMAARLAHGDKDYQNPYSVFNNLGTVVTNTLIRMTVDEAVYDGTFMAGFGATATGAHTLDSHRKKWGHDIAPVRSAREFLSAAQASRDIAAGLMTLAASRDDVRDEKSPIVSLDISHASRAAKYLENPGFSQTKERARVFALQSPQQLPDFTRDIQTGRYAGDVLEAPSTLRYRIQEPTYGHIDGTPFPVPAGSLVTLGFPGLSYQVLTSGNLPRRPTSRYHPRVLATQGFTKFVCRNIP